MVSGDGEVYCWGEEEGGKLGLAGSAGDTDYPRKVRAPKKDKTISKLLFLLRTQT